MLEGYDISAFQLTTPSLTGKAFCFARAGYGSSVVDAKYAYHAANIRTAGVVLGAYWFLYLGQDNALAVRTFLSVTGGADLLVLDVEGPANSPAGYALARDFIAKVHATGRKIGLYHSQSGFPQLGQDFDWVALWTTTPPSIPWTFWQYGGSGIDADRFNGDAAALAALVGDDMHCVKPVGSPIGTFTFSVSARALLDTTDTLKRYPNVVGFPYQVAASVDLVDATGAPIDIDGHKPPLNNRDQLYLIANGVGQVPGVFALRKDGTFVSQEDAAVLAARRAQYDADLAAANASPISLGPRP